MQPFARSDLGRLLWASTPALPDLSLPSEEMPAGLISLPLPAADSMMEDLKNKKEGVHAIWLLVTLQCRSCGIVNGRSLWSVSC